VTKLHTTFTLRHTLCKQLVVKSSSNMHVSKKPVLVILHFCR